MGEQTGSRRTGSRRPARPCGLAPIVLTALLLVLWTGARGESARQGPAVRPRSREMGIVIGRFAPGPRDAITDVAGVRVGQVTLISGKGKLVPGRGPFRTGVTAVIPREDVWHDKVPAGGAVLNGCGELTGLAWVLESGFLEVPVLYTNTHAVGRVMDALVTWMQGHDPAIGVTEDVVTPVVGECDDSTLNDIRGMAPGERDVHAALDGARPGPVDEGSVGAGTGMITCGFKAGIGTASRQVAIPGRMATVGALVVSNFGLPEDLVIAGHAIGERLWKVVNPIQAAREGSIQVLLATDAPLDARQLTRMSRRAGLGLARVGHRGHHGSGDFALAFSTAHTIRWDSKGHRIPFAILSDEDIDPVFEAAEDAVEESVLNALLRAGTMEGRDGAVAPGLPIDEVVRLLGLPAIARPAASPLAPMAVPPDAGSPAPSGRAP